MEALNKKYKELSELKDTINNMRDTLNVMLSASSDPLGDDVLTMSKALDEVIRMYTILEMELKSN